MTTRLVHTSDSDPGITRRRCGAGFSYIAPDGTTVARGPERDRLEALAVPPAYEDVWMCPLPNGHLQATGRDARARKQYRYHPDWSAERAATKFDALAAFGAALPRIRRRVRRDLGSEPGAMTFALAAAVTLIDRLALRVGSDAYAKENGSYGAITLRNRHLKLHKGRIHVDFVAKGGTRVRRQLGDRSLQRLLEKVGDLPGARLLTWIDDDGETHTLGSSRLNDYLRDAGSSDTVSAKTFRTWAGTLAAFEVAEKGDATIKAIAQAAADRLSNSAAVARQSYVHPRVIDLAGQPPPEVTPRDIDGLLASERRLLALLER